MGRRKIEMKRIEDKNSRQVTFSKRRSGLIKKARQLSVLCDVDVALLVFSSRGRLYESFTGSSSLSQVLERYQDSTASDEKASPSDKDTEQELRLKIPELQTCKELVGTVKRQLESPNLEDLSVDDFILLEEQLAAALVQSRARKTQLMLETLITLQEQDRKLKAENEELREEVRKTKKSHNNGNQIDLNIMAQTESNNDTTRGIHDNGNQLRLEYGPRDSRKNMVCGLSAEHHNENQIGVDYVSLRNTHKSCPQPQRTLALLQ